MYTNSPYLMRSFLCCCCSCCYFFRYLFFVSFSFDGAIPGCNSFIMFLLRILYFVINFFISASCVQILFLSLSFSLVRIWLYFFSFLLIHTSSVICCLFDSKWIQFMQMSMRFFFGNFSNPFGWKSVSDIP